MAVSLPGLFVDVINPDGVNWHPRAYAFAKALVKGDYSDTYQVYHPGITLMWITGPALYSLGNYFQANGVELYSKDTFLFYDYAAKLAVVIFVTLLFLVSLIILKNVLSYPSLIVFSALMIFEPFILGERRLFHLDSIMTYCLFDSFLFFYVYFFRGNKIYLLMFGCLFFILALLTKTTSLVFLPIILLMTVLGRVKFLSKVFSIPLMIIFMSLFIYILFPAIWRNPLKSVSRYAQKMYTGIDDIGLQGKKELGYSGKQESLILDETMDKKPWSFYLEVAVFRTTFGCWVLTALACLIMFVRLPSFLHKLIKKVDFDDTDHCLGLLAFITAVTFFTALTLATKSSERYTLMFLPFVLLIVALSLGGVRLRWVLVLLAVYIITLVPQYREIYPYFHAYGDPLLAGVYGKYITLNSPSFGVGIYKVFEDIKNDRKGEKGPYVIVGTKSLKAISYGARWRRTPDCLENYYVVFYSDMRPSSVCITNKYLLINTVKVGNMDYWYIYRNLTAPKNTGLAPAEDEQ